MSEVTIKLPREWADKLYLHLGALALSLDSCGIIDKLEEVLDLRASIAAQLSAQTIETKTPN